MSNPRLSPGPHRKLMSDIFSELEAAKRRGASEARIERPLEYKTDNGRHNGVLYINIKSDNSFLSKIGFKKHGEYTLGIRGDDGSCHETKHKF